MNTIAHTMQTVLEFVGNAHPAALHSHNMQRRRWDALGPVWEWYSIYGRYCHQHDHKQCRYSA